MAAEVLYCLRRAHPILLHYRLCSTTTSFSSGDGPTSLIRSPPSDSTFSFPSSSNSKHSVLEQFEKKWKQLALSLLDRYTIDGLLLSETSKSRQAFIDDTIKNLSAFSALLLPHTQEIIFACEKRNNLKKLARLVHLNELLLKQDEKATELNNYKLTFLSEIISNFLKIRSQTPLSLDPIASRTSLPDQYEAACYYRAE